MNSLILSDNGAVSLIRGRGVNLIKQAAPLLMRWSFINYLLHLLTY